MGILNFTGFEAGDNTEIEVSGTTSIVTSPVRTGTYAGRVNPSTTATGFLALGGISAQGNLAGFVGIATIYCRFYFRYATKPGSGSEEICVVRAAGATSALHVRIDSSGVLSVYNSANTLVATGTTVLAANTWYRIELRSSVGTTGAYELRIDGTTELSGTANQSTQTEQARLRLGKATDRSGQSVDFYYDDVMIRDDAFPGAGEVKRLAPTGNSTPWQWTAGTGSANYLEIDEVPHDSDTSYVASTGAAGDALLADVQDTATVSITGTVQAVKAFAIVRTPTGTGAAKIALKSGSTTSESSTRAGASAYSANANNQYQRVLTTDPDTSAAWTLAGVDAVKVGMTETNTVATRCTAISIMVAYVPVTIGSGAAAAGTLAPSGGGAKVKGDPASLVAAPALGAQRGRVSAPACSGSAGHGGVRVLAEAAAASLAASGTGHGSANETATPAEVTLSAGAPTARTSAPAPEVLATAATGPQRVATASAPAASAATHQGSRSVAEAAAGTLAASGTGEATDPDETEPAEGTLSAVAAGIRVTGLPAEAALAVGACRARARAGATSTTLSVPTPSVRASAESVSLLGTVPAPTARVVTGAASASFAAATPGTRSSAQSLGLGAAVAHAGTRVASPAVGATLAAMTPAPSTFPQGVTLEFEGFDRVLEFDGPFARTIPFPEGDL